MTQEAAHAHDDRVARSWVARGSSCGCLVVRGTAADSRLQLWSKPSAYDQYRGVLRILAAKTPTINVVNELSLETYLRGVVPVEMPSTWPGPAPKAQAIAARSYAARRLRRGVTLIGSAGSRKVSSKVFRSAFDARRPPDDPMMRSTLVATAPIP